MYMYFLLTLNHPRRPRGSAREKRWDESFQVRAKEPLGTNSHQTISKNSSGYRLVIGHKKCFVLLCPIGEQFLLSSFREFVHDSYCLATLARFVHQACAYRGNFYFLLSQPETKESKERLGCYQQEQLNLPREYSVFDGSQCIVNNRKFQMRRRRETRQNNNFARASRLFVQFLCRQLHDYPWKWLISCFAKDLNKQWQNSFSSWTWIWLIKFSSKRVRLHLWQSKRVGIITI